LFLFGTGFFRPSDSIDDCDPPSRELEMGRTR
jgi:hypothetical protein